MTKEFENRWDRIEIEAQQIAVPAPVLIGRKEERIRK
jgi:hypothetical protein